MQVIDKLSEQLTELRLYGMKDVLVERMKQATKDDTDFASFLSIIFQDEIDYKKSSRIARLLKKAEFKDQASLEGFDLSIQRGISKKLINDFSTTSFARDGLNVIISGPTGVGKSYLSQGIGNYCCRQGLSVMFRRMNKLIEETVLARAKGTYLNLLKRLSAVDVLILDDFGIKPLQPQQYQDFYDLIDERGENKTTILTTQLPIENWGEIIEDPVTCEAVTDRLAACAINVKMKGDSYRPERLKKSRV